MIARLYEIGKDLKDANRKIDSLTDALLKVNSKAEKVAIEYKLRNKKYRKLEKKHNTLVERLSLMNTQTYVSTKSLKGIERKKVLKVSMITKMSTPAYRELKNRLSNMDWYTSPQNLLNRADKSAIQLNKLIPALKKIALHDGANLLPFYMYLDNEFMDIEHLCFLAHAMAKWNQIFAYRNDGEYSIEPLNL